MDTEIQFEIGHFNIHQLNEILRLFNKINYDDIKKEFDNYTVSYGKSKIKLYFNLFKLYHDKIKEILNRVINENKIFITNNEYNELRLLIQYTNLSIINPVIIGLVKFYFYNFSFDIIYILQKKLIKNSSAFKGLSIQIGNYGNYTIKKYLIDFESQLEITEEKMPKYSYEYQKLLDLNKNIKFDDTTSNYYFNSEFVRHIDAIDENEIKSLDEIKINVIKNDEILKDISNSINTVFDKKVSREKYANIITEILKSTDEIQQMELYKNLNEYLKLFGNKQELDKLNYKYKHQIGFLKIKDDLLHVINFLVNKSSEIPEDKQEIKLTFNFLVKILSEEFLNEDIKEVSISKNLVNILFLIDELKSLIKLDEIEIIIKSIYELTDFFIDYVNNNYDIIVKDKNPIPTYDKIVANDLTGLIQFGGNNYGYKKMLKKYK